MRLLSNNMNSREATPELGELGALADILARQLWRVSEGESEARQSKHFDEAVGVFRSIAQQLQEPYYARPVVGLPTALRLAHAAERQDETAGEDLAAQRNQASKFFSDLADGVVAVQEGSASEEEAGKLADMFDLVGAAAMSVRSSLAPSRETRKWTTM